MVITDFLERNARLYGSDTALVEVNPSEERDSAVTWREASLIAEAQPDAPYRRELSWRDFDRRANRFANFLLSRGVERGTKVGILLMNCLEWLPIYFGILKAGCIAVPLNFRYASDEISYCLDLADVEVLVFGPEFVSRLDPIQESLTRVKIRLFVGRNVPGYAEDCRRLMGFCSSSVPPIALSEDDDAAIYFSSGTTGFPKAILHRHKALVCSCMTEQHHHGQTKDDVFLCIPPLYHTGAKMHWFGSLISGSKAVLLRGVKPEWILRTITEEKCTIVWLLVPWAQDILDAIESGRVNLDHYLLDQWRLMHIGAQPVPRPGEDTDKLAKLFDSGKIRLIIATPTHGRDPMRAGFRLRRMAVEYGIACVTSIDTAKLLMKCVKLGKKAEDVPPLGLHDLIL